jgi:hypothetical protein
MSDETPHSALSRIDDIDLHVMWLVLFGGLSGGLLLLLMGDGFFRHGNIFVRIAQASFLGMAAAGIGVFVLANTDLTNRYRLLFFAMICGLSFPIVIEGARDLIRNRPAMTKAEQTKSDFAEATSPRAAAETLAAAIVQQPASAVPPAAADTLIAAQLAAIEQLASHRLPVTMHDRIDGLRELAIAAGRAGYVEPAQRAADELTRLGKSPDDAVAEEARDAQAEVVKDWTGIDSTVVATATNAESTQPR